MMKIKTSIGPFFLLVGDICVLTIALWVTLLLRYLELPGVNTFYVHLLAFLVIFPVWIFIYFIYDLYSNQTSLLQSRLANLLFNAHIINSVIALAFFYFIPFFAITPKTNLFIFLVISFFFILGWRRYLVFILGAKDEEKIIFTCEGSEVEELTEEFTHNPLYKISASKNENLNSAEITERSAVVVINTYDPHMADSLVNFYNMLFNGVRFVTVDGLYESVFARIPLSLISERWFLESISLAQKSVYDFFKRVMDVVVATILGIISLVFYPFVYLAIKTEDGGQVFIRPERVGKNNKQITLYKFRTMTVGNDEGNWGTVENKVTKVGNFLRKSRIDELPQFWNVVKGDLSLIGPRPEFKSAVLKYSDEIKFYNVRHLIKPGLSGWAQISQSGEPHHGLSISTTAIKLSYDLYYIKHRSVLLDIKIALKTVRILLSRSGI